MRKIEIDSKYIHIEIVNGLLIGTPKPGLNITLEIAEDIVKTRVGFAGSSKSYPILVYLKGIISVNKEARHYFAKEGIAGITAGALLVDSVYSRLLGVFFLNLAKPPIPSQIFNDKAKAIEWLEQYK